MQAGIKCCDAAASFLWQEQHQPCLPPFSSYNSDFPLMGEKCTSWNFITVATAINCTPISCHRGLPAILKTSLQQMPVSPVHSGGDEGRPWKVTPRVWLVRGPMGMQTQGPSTPPSSPGVQLSLTPMGRQDSMTSVTYRAHSPEEPVHICCGLGRQVFLGSALGFIFCSF